MSDSVLTDVFAVVPPILGMLWAVKELMVLKRVHLTGPAQGSDLKTRLMADGSTDIQKTLDLMQEISRNIADGATAFLIQEYKYMLVYVVIFSAIIGPCVNVGTMISFIVGSLTSIACGYIGMKTAVFSNVRTAHEAWKDLASGYDVAIRGGSVMGFMLVSLGVLNLFILVSIYNLDIFYGADHPTLYEAIAGYGLGGSSIALFGRVGGGIYTKAADVGADLSGKNEYGMDEDDPRNPACIADNVGDNVGDVAGMGADLFGSFAESTCAAMVISASAPHYMEWKSMMFPLLLSSGGIVVGLITMMVVNIFYKVKELPDIEKALKGVLVISTILETPLVAVLCWWALPAGHFAIDTERLHCTWGNCCASVLLGLWSGLIIGYSTEYYTSHSYTPVREISDTQKVSAATGIIYGLALGYLSCIIPVLCLAVTVCIAHTIAGMYGVALGALGMLGTLSMGLTIDAYGPISDNAGGIAEMSELGPEVRARTDALDAAGNTTAAIGKGFAIGSAALVSLALFGAYCVRARVETVNILDPWTFTGLLFGAMMPYAFSAMTMKSVGKAANDMVTECMRQFPKIISGEMRPQYTRCIAISTEASLREMIAPGCLVILSPLIAGLIFGKNCTAGLLSGALVSGVQMAISMSNTGGAWDNAKKYIEAGGLGPNHQKGSAAHKNAVTGDTVGDPLKDTSGPSINILMKLSAIMSLVFGGVIRNFSNKEGGPFWL
ncbi:H+-translocating inorganic pyrophosphatase TVP1, putative [Perkinsus marinus ATCC 50983]|uniref:H(+)-exporting diphosphatase n=1 Tax=Perkinsus marinus (strain ATCC 50983 / TXsc) TaxID=423536 RepID=C5KBD1_PERM5|nr:H+-translocating inorganic pyrophosphatase TVP1, putative [Perkinsus marinus ATCC 50983]EER18457.1 H+-translocating inorganic pyrophosphatase TVP1, putative [Perkinsus marinus ATCC 50983]|eukprot:XP_002786661.1 H+-translocating inorganic pyrophosphatase TVP1, putative [Perkinsus marinus ATCC 50983]